MDVQLRVVHDVEFVVVDNSMLMRVVAAAVVAMEVEMEEYHLFLQMFLLLLVVLDWDLMREMDEHRLNE
jgi:hypothetical protein